MLTPTYQSDGPRSSLDSSRQMRQLQSCGLPLQLRAINCLAALMLCEAAARRLAMSLVR